MQRLSLQAEVRSLKALTHGLQAIPAHRAWLRDDREPKTFGVSGPNNVITSAGVSVA